MTPTIIEPASPPHEDSLGISPNDQVSLLRVSPQTRDLLLPKIRGLSERAAELYSEEWNLDHYCRLSDTVEERFHDETLTSAAFLHGIPVETVRSLRHVVEARNEGELEAGEVSSVLEIRQVLDVLEEWSRLVLLNPSRSNFRSTLQDTLASLHWARSAVLLVYNCLDRIDPSGELSRWTHQFRQTPQRPIFSGLANGTSPSSTPYIEQVAGPIAEHLGLWHERNVLRNASLYLRNQDLFHEALEFALKCQEICGEYQKIIHDAFKERSTDVDLTKMLTFRWEWRHIASIGGQLSSVKRETWAERLHLCGFVTITCPNHQYCYRMLWHLHDAFDYRVDYFRDAIGRPTRSGYRALHTLLVDVGPNKRQLAIRLIPHNYRQDYFRPLKPDYLDDLQHRLKTLHADEIRIFSPRGRPHYLPSDSTVLDFACDLKPFWVGHVRQALLNQSETVDILHPLRPGDIVHLVIEEAPKPLPEGWESKVSPASTDKILSGLRLAFRETLEDAGKQLLEERLGISGLGNQLLDLFLEPAIANLAEINPRIPKPFDLSWCLQQLGLLSRRQRSHELPFDPVLSEEESRIVLENLAQNLQRLRMQAPALDVEPEGALAREAKVCFQCRPNRRNRITITFDGVTAVLHRQGAPCAEGGTEIEAPRVSLDQVLVVETRNRVGFALDLLSIFSEFQVDVLELVALQLGATWGVARIEVEPIGQDLLKAIVQRIRRLPGVSQVHPPGAAIPPIVESALPRRPEIPQSPLSKPPPYVCGPVVRDAEYFYGRDQEIEQLGQHLAWASSPDATKGERVFVCGPLKVGKTSLVQHFQHQQELRQDQHFVSLYHKAAVDQTWADAIDQISAQLRKKVSAVVKYWQQDLPEFPPGGDLADHLEAVTTMANRPTVIVAIDEIVRLLKAAQREHGAVAEMLQICERLDRLPGVLLLWIGPLEPSRSLDPELQDLLTSSHPLHMQPLSADDTRALLQAKKITAHDIKVPKEVAQHVHRLTAGNPFWIAHLGNTLWTRYSKRGETPIKFTRNRVTRAMSELVHLTTPFQGRILPSGIVDPRERLMMAILFALVDGHTGTSRLPQLTTTQLQFKLKREGVDLAQFRLEDALDDLAARGGVKHPSQKLSRWQISAPVLAEFVKYQFTKTGWENVRFETSE